jgi:hypothetical protein
MFFMKQELVDFSILHEAGFSFFFMKQELVEKVKATEFK